MEIGNWNDKYSVNNAIIDDQHRHLLDILYRLERQVNHGGDPQVMVGLLTEMSDYAMAHFKSEERYMKSIGYPHLEKHQQPRPAHGQTVASIQVRPSKQRVRKRRHSHLPQKH